MTDVIWFVQEPQNYLVGMVGNQDRVREPCPDRIIDDLGSSFGIGVIGGGAFHYLKGIYNSPKGERFVHGVQAMRMNAPRLGGGFAAWGGLFSISDCSLVYLRQKEDPWNSIIAGAATGGFLSMRQGLGRASRAALWGGLLLAMVEGAGIMLNKLGSMQTPPMEDGLPNMADFYGLPPMPGQHPSKEKRSQPSSSSSSWFGGLFGGGKKQEETSGGSKTEILESFDAPSPPTFEFK
ncbi:unnamed protein product [Rhodiola kirilowii]